MKLNLNDVRVKHEAGVNLCSVRYRLPETPYKDRIYNCGKVEHMSEQNKSK